MTEYELIDQVILAFQEETGLLLRVHQVEADHPDRGVDAVLKLPNHGGEIYATVKKWAQHGNLGALANQVKQLPGEGLLVADYVNPNMAEKLKDMQVQFMDAAGNAYINRLPLYNHLGDHYCLELQRT